MYYQKTGLVIGSMQHGWWKEAFMRKPQELHQKPGRAAQAGDDTQAT